MEIKLIPTAVLKAWKITICLDNIAVSKIIDYLDIDIQNTLVIHDELDLPFGEIKFKESGGHGGHNGLRNIIDHLNGNPSFKRLRIGIGHPGIKEMVSSYVLENFSNQDRELIDKKITRLTKNFSLIFENDSLFLTKIAS